MPSPAPNPIDEFVIVIVSGEQAGDLTARLTRDGFYVTQMDSSGGLLQEAQTSLLVGLHGSRRERLLEHIRVACRRQRRFIPAHLEGSSSVFHPAVIEAEVGGALAFVLKLERFEQL